MTGFITTFGHHCGRGRLENAHNNGMTRPSDVGATYEQDMGSNVLGQWCYLFALHIFVFFLHVSLYVYCTQSLNSCVAVVNAMLLTILSFMASIHLYQLICLLNSIKSTFSVSFLHFPGFPFSSRVSLKACILPQWCVKLPSLSFRNSKKCNFPPAGLIFMRKARIEKYIFYIQNCPLYPVILSKCNVLSLLFVFAFVTLPYVCTFCSSLTCLCVLDEIMYLVKYWLNILEVDVNINDQIKCFMLQYLMLLLVTYLTLIQASCAQPGSTLNLDISLCSFYERYVRVMQLFISNAFKLRRTNIVCSKHSSSNRPCFKSSIGSAY